MLLLGDQLIRDAGIAVFELVKNAYDADASGCIITLHDIDKDEEAAHIVVEDDGHGMDMETVLNVWLEPGTEYRRRQRLEGRRTNKGRLPLGEKGVGRFAAHKLGRRIQLVTRRTKCPELVVNIDWRDFAADKYLSEVPVSVTEREPRVFKGRKSGTRIQVTDLRERPWTRRRVRSLYRSVTSICSPFEGPEGFAPMLEVAPDSDWLEGLFPADEALDHALFRFKGWFDGKTLHYSYEFKPRYKLRGVEGRKVNDRELALRYQERDPETRKNQQREIDLNRYSIGRVGLEFRIFDREPAVLALTETDPSGLLGFLNTMGGVRVYRDGVRVYDFGEPGNDWLELGGRRVNVPVRRISKNLVIGAVRLNSEHSTDLLEKTNREGFVENRAYEAFRSAVSFAVQQAETERNMDKGRIRKLYSRGRRKEPVLADLVELRNRVQRLGLEEDLGQYLDRIESQYREVQDRLLVAAGAGLNLAAVMHEVEKGIHDLRQAIEADLERTRLVALARRLSDMVDGLSWLTKKSGRTRESAGRLISQAILNSEFRFRAHKICIVNGMELDDPEFRVRCSRRLILAALMNLIDNSIYWLDNKGSSDKRIYLGTTYEMNGLPAIVVADNGPGFVDPPEYMVQPFFTRKPDGIGLGLHITEEVMKSQNGRLLFPQPGDITLPRQFTGAVILLEFGDTK